MSTTKSAGRWPSPPRRPYPALFMISLSRSVKTSSHIGIISPERATVFLAVSHVNRGWALVQKVWRLRDAEGTCPSAGGDGPRFLCSEGLNPRGALPPRDFRIG